MLGLPWDKDKCGCTVLHINVSNKSILILHFSNKKHEKE